MSLDFVLCAQVYMMCAAVCYAVSPQNCQRLRGVFFHSVANLLRENNVPKDPRIPKLFKI